MNDFDPTDISEDPIRDQLVAYLDGELDADEAQRVEERLASDEAFRGELQRLAVAWDCLDQLSRQTVDETFTQTTVEMVAVAAEQDVARQSAALPGHRRTRRLAIGGMLAASVLVGFLGSHIIWPNQNKQIERDLPVIANLDLYSQVDDIAFLRMLYEQEVFAEETNDEGN